MQYKGQQKAKKVNSGGTRTHNLSMASPGSLKVQCAIHCATEPHLKTYFGLCEPFTVRSVGRKHKVLGSLRSWNAV